MTNEEFVEVKEILDKVVRPLIKNTADMLDCLFSILPNEFQAIQMVNKVGNCGYYVKKVRITSNEDHSAESSDFSSEEIEFGDAECDISEY